MKWKNQYLDDNCFFITSSMNGYRPILDLKGIPELLLDNFQKCRILFGLKLFGYIIMPEHWHILVHFDNGKDCQSFIRDYKRFTAKEIISVLQNLEELEAVEYFNDMANGMAMHSVWKEQARVIPIAKIDDIKAKLDYIHNNPVKRGLVKSADKYLLSSAGYYLRGDSNGIEIDNFDSICENG